MVSMTSIYLVFLRIHILHPRDHILKPRIRHDQRYPPSHSCPACRLIVWDADVYCLVLTITPQWWVKAVRARLHGCCHPSLAGPTTTTVMGRSAHTPVHAAYTHRVQGKIDIQIPSCIIVSDV